jgi:hypothetical protein
MMGELMDGHSTVECKYTHWPRNRNPDHSGGTLPCFCAKKASEAALG